MRSIRKASLRLGTLAVLLATSLPARAQCELETQEIAPPDGQPGDAFGYRLARSGNLAVMAAPFDDDLGFDAGAAYVYERDPVAGWTLAAKLRASNGSAGDSFGYSVAIAGATVLVGAPSHDSLTTPDRGSVYAFERDRHGTWREISRLAPPAAGEGAQFGYSLAAHGDRILVGMPYTGRPVEGAALLYARDPSILRGWKLELEFTAADPATRPAFGHTVALADDVLAVAGSTESILPYSSSYVIHVRERDAGGPGNWGEVRTLASPTGTRDIFGYKLALTSDALAVVAPAEILPPAFLYGAVYLYVRGPGGELGWGLARRLYSPNAPNGVFTAEQCLLSGDWLVVGVPGGSVTGSVHLFGRNVGGPETWGEAAMLQGEAEEEDVYTGYGQGLALEGNELLIAQSGYALSTTGGEVYAYDLARLARSEWRGDTVGVNFDSWNAGPALLGGTFVGTVNLGTTGHPLAILNWFTDEAEIPLPGGQVLLGVNRFHHTTMAGPLARFEVEIPNVAALCGKKFVTQAAHVGGGLPFILSNAVDVTFGVH